MECKKMAALVLAGAMAVTTMTGCGSAGGSDKYPSKDISVIIPKAAGGGTDTAARGLIQQIYLEFLRWISTGGLEVRIFP